MVCPLWRRKTVVGPVVQVSRVVLIFSIVSMPADGGRMMVRDDGVFGVTDVEESLCAGVSSFAGVSCAGGRAVSHGAAPSGSGVGVCSYFLRVATRLLA